MLIRQHDHSVVIVSHLGYWFIKLSGTKFVSGMCSFNMYSTQVQVFSNNITSEKILSANIYRTK